MSRTTDTTNSSISTWGIKNIIEQLKSQRFRDSTRKNYYAIWKIFNQFFIRLDCKPSTWEDRLTLFVGYLVQNNRQSATVKSYISAIKAVLQEVNVKIHEDRYLLTSLTKACRLKSDTIAIRLPIQKGMLSVLMKNLVEMFSDQPYLRDLYRALFSTAYFGLFRVGELTKGEHPILAKDVHIGINKKQMLFILRMLKTHWKNVKPQLIKISSECGERADKQSKLTANRNVLPCPFEILRRYLANQGPFKRDTEPFSVFRNGQHITPTHFRSCLKRCLKHSGFDEKNYNTHSLRLGQTCDLYRMGLPIEIIK